MPAAVRGDACRNGYHDVGGAARRHRHGVDRSPDGAGEAARTAAAHADVGSRQSQPPAHRSRWSRPRLSCRSWVAGDALSTGVGATLSTGTLSRVAARLPLPARSRTRLAGRSTSTLSVRPASGTMRAAHSQRVHRGRHRRGVAVGHGKVGRGEGARAGGLQTVRLGEEHRDVERRVQGGRTAPSARHHPSPSARCCRACRSRRPLVGVVAVSALPDQSAMS